MPKRIVLIQGHPDRSSLRFCRSLAAAYVDAAKAAGHTVDVIDVASLDFPLLKDKTDFEKEDPPPAIRSAQGLLAMANHIVIIFPLWLGDTPALLKGFFEQTFRPGFAYGVASGAHLPRGLLKGKSARIFVTMGMPAAFYRFYFWAHGLKNLRRNILRFCGVHPIRETLIGLIESPNVRMKEDWLDVARRLGRKGV